MNPAIEWLERNLDTDTELLPGGVIEEGLRYDPSVALIELNNDELGVTPRAMIEIFEIHHDACGICRSEDEMPE